VLVQPLHTREGVGAVLFHIHDAEALRAFQLEEVTAVREPRISADPRECADDGFAEDDAEGMSVTERVRDELAVRLLEDVDAEIGMGKKKRVQTEDRDAI
jgi:hypothetical protein